MKKEFLLFFAFLFFAILRISAQNVEAPKAFKTSYNRPSMTFFYMKFTDEKHSSDVEGKINSLDFPEKFDDNNFNQMVFNAPFNRLGATAKPEELIRQKLQSDNVGKDILNKWFNRRGDGTMDMELIKERGRFDATDAAYNVAQMTQRGESALMDFGENLIKLSYILVLDFQNISTMAEQKDTKSIGWSADVNIYLFKVKFDDEIQSTLYNSCWINKDDSPEQRNEKIKKYNQLEIPVEFVYKSTRPVLVSNSESKDKVTDFNGTMSALLESVVQEAYNKSITRLEMKIEDFKVKTPIYQIHPTRAKIGLKEGLKCDNRYFAYEFVYRKKTNSSVPRRRGVIRATSEIVDNRQLATGNMGTSRFYQTSGLKLQPGYLLKQELDRGLEFYGGMEVGEVGGYYGRFDYRFGRLIGIPAQFIYVDVAYEEKTYDLTNYGGNKDTYNFLRIGLGFAKGFMLTRNTEIRPYFGGGVEFASDLIDYVFIKSGSYYNPIPEKDKSKFTGPMTYYLKGGANLALNLRHNIQLTGGVGYYLFVKNAFVLNKDAKSVDAYFEHNGTYKVVNWSDLFKDRKGISIMAGLRLGF